MPVKITKEIDRASSYNICSYVYTLEEKTRKKERDAKMQNKRPKQEKILRRTVPGRWKSEHKWME